MGNPNQEDWVRMRRELVQGPVLEIGSKDYGSTPDLRVLFPGIDYIGVDMEAGKGVDCVLDLTAPLAELDCALGGKRFRTMFCFSVMEHCRNPFRMAENLTGLMAPGGRLFLSVPFVWEVHGFPSDYWRFTPDGLKVLFEGFDFPAAESTIATTIRGEMKLQDATMFGIPVKTSLRHGQFRKHGFFRGLFLYLCRKLRVHPRLFGADTLYPMVMVNMIGVKR